MGGQARGRDLDEHRTKVGVGMNRARFGRADEPFERTSCAGRDAARPAARRRRMGRLSGRRDKQTVTPTPAITTSAISASKVIEAPKRGGGPDERERRGCKPAHAIGYRMRAVASLLEQAGERFRVRAVAPLASRMRPKNSRGASDGERAVPWSASVRSIAA